MNSPARELLRFAVVHVGARLHYAVPSVLQEAGMLQVVYTDAHARSPLMCLAHLIPKALQPRAIRRLMARQIPETIPPSKIRSSMWPTIEIEWINRRKPHLRKNAEFWNARGVGAHRVASVAIQDQFAGANALYVHPCVSTQAILEAKRRKMFVVLEAISHPFNKFIEKSEYEHFGVTAPQPDAELNENLQFFKNEALLADLVVVASPYVREGLINLGLEPNRIEVVPYGFDPGIHNQDPEPDPERVLYVGKIGYLKGIPYLAAAARILKQQGCKGEIRAVGPLEQNLIARPEFKGLNYVGQVPRSEVQHEFSKADVFAFPPFASAYQLKNPPAKCAL